MNQRASSVRLALTAGLAVVLYAAAATLLMGMLLGGLAQARELVDSLELFWIPMATGGLAVALAPRLLASERVPAPLIVVVAGLPWLAGIGLELALRQSILAQNLSWLMDGVELVPQTAWFLAYATRYRLLGAELSAPLMLGLAAGLWLARRRHLDERRGLVTAALGLIALGAVAVALGLREADLYLLMDELDEAGLQIGSLVLDAGRVDRLRGLSTLATGCWIAAASAILGATLWALSGRRLNRNRRILALMPILLGVALFASDLWRHWRERGWMSYVATAPWAEKEPFAPLTLAADETSSWPHVLVWEDRLRLWNRAEPIPADWRSPHGQARLAQILGELITKERPRPPDSPWMPYEPYEVAVEETPWDTRVEPLPRLTAAVTRDLSPEALRGVLAVARAAGACAVELVGMSNGGILRTDGAHRSLQAAYPLLFELGEPLLVKVEVFVATPGSAARADADAVLLHGEYDNSGTIRIGSRADSPVGEFTVALDGDAPVVDPPDATTGYDRAFGGQRVYVRLSGKVDPVGLTRLAQHLDELHLGLIVVEGAFLGHPERAHPVPSIEEQAAARKERRRLM